MADERDEKDHRYSSIYSLERALSRHCPRLHSITEGVSSKYSRRESDSSATFSNSGSTLNGSTLGSETEDEENDEESSKIPLQSSQRQAGSNVPSPTISRKLTNDHMDYPNAQSTNSTITSVNSISSLLKEKLQWTIPAALRSSKKRQNADYRLRGFVGFLFLCVVFLVGFAHVYYTQHVLQRAYFDKFRFNKNERVMHVYNNMGVEIIAARLGVGIPPDTGVFNCLPQHQRQDKVCLEWLQHSRLYLGHTKRDNMNCYHVTWQALSPGVNPQDCFDWSAKRGHWYGAGQIQNMAYPLEQGRLEPSPFITGDIRKHPFGNVLKRYFLNSKGATITVDPETPLYVSINFNVTQKKELCLMAKHDAFAFINHLTPYPQLNYSICSTDNMKNLHSSMAEKFLWDGLKPDELQAVHSLLTEPVWQISPTNEADIYNYTEDVIALGFLRQGHVLLSEEWQPSSGDFVLDETRFKSMKDTIDVIHRRGFRIVFTVQPFISTESENFKDAVSNRLLISERGSDPRIPALTRYHKVNSAGVLDITNNKTLPWIQSKLEDLKEKYQVDSFYLDLGTAQDMPHYYKCEQPLTNPDHYKSLFVNSILGSVPVIGVSSAIARPRAPVFVSLPPFPSSWKAIKTVIPTVLSYGIIGYPFIMPGAVGGDVALPMSDNNPDNDYEVTLPEKELYIRWLQLSTFLPVIRFTHLPSKYSDDQVLEIAKSLTTLRQKTVTPLLKKYANVTLDTGLPIIRPLWMLDPMDQACHLVVDEFSVGDELIVAPILHSGSRQREVYLPAGVWKDGIDKSLRKGSRWIHNYRVAEDKVAYFVKMPDDMRF
ncbi:myogenesis-regulating glycosidase isoform X3 [Nasonia vitripennis]|uniref:Myogenesis-regulating glycosidase n=1 Tax=Nasonia vitripennis TaxID=7425 RepID=A0A7M7IVU4_NASVI|nr:myogenesis-regulating glycosidase isoform X3 [Nasonia vitripennis]